MWRSCWTAASKQASTNSNQIITFIFGLITLGEKDELYPLKLWLNSTTTVPLQEWLLL